MRDDMVMRSVYLRPDEDSALRQLAFDIKVTKSDLIRSAISAKLVEWLKGNDPEIILKDLALGRRLSPAERAERARAEGVAQLQPSAAAKPKATTNGAGAGISGVGKKAETTAPAPMKKAKTKGVSQESAPAVRQVELAGAGF